MRAELLAGLIEVVDVGNRAFVMAHSKKGSEKPKPVQIRRPEDGPRPIRKPTPIEDLVAFFGPAKKQLLAPNGEPIAALPPANPNP